MGLAIVTGVAGLVLIALANGLGSPVFPTSLGPYHSHLSAEVALFVAIFAAMAYQEVSRVEIKEVLRHWQAGGSQRAIARSTGLSRTTVRKYILAAEQADLHQGGPPPTEEQLNGLVPLNLAGPRQVRIPTQAVLEPWRTRFMPG